MSFFIGTAAVEAKYLVNSTASVTTVPVYNLATDELDVVDMAFVAIS
jgi:hypothetical protein